MGLCSYACHTMARPEGPVHGRTRREMGSSENSGHVPSMTWSWTLKSFIRPVPGGQGTRRQQRSGHQGVATQTTGGSCKKAGKRHA